MVDGHERKEDHACSDQAGIQPSKIYFGHQPEIGSVAIELKALDFWPYHSNKSNRDRVTIECPSTRNPRFLGFVTCRIVLLKISVVVTALQEAACRSCGDGLAVALHMNLLASAGIGALAGISLNLIYRRIQSDWPENYFSLADYASHLKSQIPSRYVLFRFGPVVALGLFFSRQLAGQAWPVWPFVATALVVHLAPTSLRAVWRLFRFRKDGDRSSALILLHLVFAATVAGCLWGAALLQGHLSTVVPDVGAVRDGLWTGLVASLLAFGFLHWTRTPERALSDVVSEQRKRVGPELISFARFSAFERGLDPDFVEAVILAECRSDRGGSATWSESKDSCSEVARMESCR